MFVVQRVRRRCEPVLEKFTQPERSTRAGAERLTPLHSEIPVPAPQHRLQQVEASVDEQGDAVHIGGEVAG